MRGNMAVVGKLDLKSESIVFGNIDVATIAVKEGAIIQGFVNTTSYLTAEESRKEVPEEITLESFVRREDQNNPNGSGNI